MDRRRFIKNSTMGAGVVSNLNIGNLTLNAFQPNYAPVENDNVMVIIQLNGGNDGMNSITPYEWDKYYNIYRPKLAIPQNTVIPISKELGMAFNPMLAKGPNEGMYGIYKAGKLAIINGVGYENPNFSHFRSTDIWLSGIVPGNDSTPLASGWMGRYYDSFDETQAESPFVVQIGETSSLMFLGKTGPKSVVIKDVENFFNQSKGVETNKVSISGSSYFVDEFNYLSDIGQKVDKYATVMKKAFDKGKNIQDYPEHQLAQQLKMVARLIDGGLKSKVYFVELNGFDNHATQGVLDGVHARLLSELSEAVSSFQKDIEKLGHADRVIGITASEFGRRPYENGSGGTDHGTSSVMFAFGNNVRGEIFGEYFGFLYFRDAFNLTFSLDFRSIYYEIMISWFNQPKDFAIEVLGAAFPYAGEKGFIKVTEPDPELPPPIKVLPPPNVEESPRYVTETDTFVLYPNPVIENYAFLQMNLYISSGITITQFGIDGKDYGVLHKGPYRAGLHNIFLNIKGGPGAYILKIVVGRRIHTIKLMKL